MRSAPSDALGCESSGAAGRTKSPTTPLFTAIFEGFNPRGVDTGRLIARAPSGALYPHIEGERRTGSSLDRCSGRAQGGPGGLARRPEVVELDRVLVGVHAVPEALVAVGVEPAV